MIGIQTAHERAERLMRFYPDTWRQRYGDEFTELLIADLTERPKCTSRTLDVVRGGLVARLSGAGVIGPMAEPELQASTNIAVLGVVLMLFLTLGISVWSQLAIGWQWSPPNTSATIIAMVTMSAGILLFVLLGVAAAVPLVVGILRACARREARVLRRPLLLIGISALVLIVGSRHFANGWPGTGGHPWAHQGLVPGGVAAFAWAATLSITSYWAHPSMLLAFPVAEVVWMVISPLALFSLAVGVVKVVRRVDLSPSALRFEAFVGSTTAIVMEVFLGAVCWWVLGGGSGPRGLFRTGSIDVAALVIMAGTVALALRTSRRARAASHLLINS